MPRRVVRHVRHVLRLSVAAVLASALTGLGATASAGGWAVASLDAVPAATPGGSAQVGFTILQHGVTPVDIDEGVGIELVHPDGTTEFFAAAGSGTTGHYVATVTFPETAGSYAWNIRMGGFGPYALGTLDVGSGSAAATGSGGSAWQDARWALLALTAVLATVAIADLAIGRRRRTPVLT